VKTVPGTSELPEITVGTEEAVVAPPVEAVAVRYMEGF
jgi:hypothetical protein